MKPDFSRRRGVLRRRVQQEQLDGLLVTSETNVTYLTGFTGDASYLWLGARQDLLLSDSRYQTQIEEECPDLPSDIRDARTNLQQSVARMAKSLKCRRLGIEADHVNKSWFDLIESLVSCELVDTHDWVENLRAIKDSIEIQAIRRAIAVNEKAFQVIRAKLTGAQTERQIAHDLENQIRRFGGSGCAFEPIVGVGIRSALPHGRAASSRIEESRFVLIDWGARVEGYVSDLTRVLVTAKIPPKIRKIYDVVLKAQTAAIQAIAPGVPFKDVDAVARGIIQQAGFGKKFGHGLGHGIGLQVHENPLISPIRDGVFQAGMVVTVEPGIYLPGVGGVRIEDDVLVTKNGSEVLSCLPRELEPNEIDW